MSRPTEVLLTGLRPVARADARVLVLGSMPGAASLAAARYYAHAANAFWPLISAVLDCQLPGSYAARCALLRRHGIALWDVVHRCVRPGSLDADIAADTVEANDIPGFLVSHPRVAQVFFNGAAAETLFRRHVVHRLHGPQPCYARLPSSSPAHAARSFEQKLLAWRGIATVLDRNSGDPGGIRRTDRATDG